MAIVDKRFFLVFIENTITLSFEQFLGVCSSYFQHAFPLEDMIPPAFNRNLSQPLKESKQYRRLITNNCTIQINKSTFFMQETEYYLAKNLLNNRPTRTGALKFIWSNILDRIQVSCKGSCLGFILQ